MPAYVLLLTLTPEGREKLIRDSGSFIRAQDKINVPGVQVLGQYLVLGDYDFVCIVESPDNEAAARFSLEMGVLAGVHVVTMPTIPVSRLESSHRQPPEWIEESVSMPVPGRRSSRASRPPGDGDPAAPR